ncbi:MAG: hypothetical protein K0R93_3267 [Anaerosolibacter sp.]|jgi:hypothetical protein|nr:hypothetical protein [Anaerosolibacter sp.]
MRRSDIIWTMDGDAQFLRTEIAEGVPLKLKRMIRHG